MLIISFEVAMSENFERLEKSKKNFPMKICEQKQISGHFKKFNVDGSFRLRSLIRQTRNRFSRGRRLLPLLAEVESTI